MKRVLADTEIRTQLIEAGNRLLHPPSSIDQLLNLLETAEQLLVRVDQGLSRASQDAMLPIMKALIRDDLLMHSDMDIKVSVADCISEITRITAPDAPYDDDTMKEYFQLAVEVLENLCLLSGHCYMKAIAVLDSLARCRSCLVMLDLECDSLIVKMFRIFLKVIRPNHPHIIFVDMEAIMTLVIDESDKISEDLLSPLLASVRKENRLVSPISWKLGKKVLSNCTAKLQPYLKEIVQSIGIALDEYAPIVASIYRNESDSLDDEDGYESGEHMADADLSPNTASKSESATPPSKRVQRPISLLNLNEVCDDHSCIPKDKKARKISGLTSHVKRSEKPDLPLKREKDTESLGHTFKGVNGLVTSSSIQRHSLPDKTPPKRGRPRKDKNLPLLKGETTRAEAEGNNSRSVDDKRKGTSQSAMKLFNGEQNHLEKTPNSKQKKKRGVSKNMGSRMLYHADKLIGRSIMVWWPLDEKFYEGVVSFYDPLTEKHAVVYADGDKEMLNLKKERWELVGEDDLTYETQEADFPNAVKPADMSGTTGSNYKTIVQKQSSISDDVVDKASQVDGVGYTFGHSNTIYVAID